MDNNDALISIGNFNLPEPSKYEGNTSTIVDSSRNTKGEVIGAVIRDDVAKVSVSWNYLTVEEWSKINKLFNPANEGRFINSVTFFDQTQGKRITRPMYVSDRSAGAWRRNHETGELIGWTSCKLSLVEV